MKIHGSTNISVVRWSLRNKECFHKPDLCSWWCHQMETFSALLALCAENSSVTGEFLSQRPVTRSSDAFFDLHLNKRLSKLSWGWWFETPSRPLWRHCNTRITRPMPWLLMPWLLALPGYDERPRYWQRPIGRSLVCTRKVFKYLCHFSMDVWYEMHIHTYLFPLIFRAYIIQYWPSLGVLHRLNDAKLMWHNTTVIIHPMWGSHYQQHTLLFQTLGEHNQYFTPYCAGD